MLSISIAEDDGRTLKEFLEAKLIDLRREISHTDSPRFRQTLYELEGGRSRNYPRIAAADDRAITLEVIWG